MKKIIIPLFLFMAWFACTTSKHSTAGFQPNKSYYLIQRYENKMQDSAAVIGRMSNIIDETLPCFVIMVDSRVSYKAECDGKVVMLLAPGSHYFTGFWIGYDSVKTKNIQISGRDSIHIHFHLESNVSLHQK